MEFKSSNPVFGARFFSEHSKADEAMTLQGTINKTLILLGLVVLTTIPTFKWAMNPEVIISGKLYSVLIGSAILGLIVGLIAAFTNKENTKFIAPVYALIEGVLVGALSGFLNFIYPGVAFQAIILTLGVLFLMLGLYRTGIVQPTEKFKAGMLAAVGALSLFYLFSFMWFLISGTSLMAFSSPISIGVSVIAVILASFSLILDFDEIYTGVERGAPKHMEWYAAFGLMVTIVWLYIEILKLLAKLRDR